MKKKLILLGISVVFAAVQGVMAVQVAKTDEFDIHIYGRLQEVTFGEFLEDPYRDHVRFYLFLKQSRLGFRGTIMDKFEYNIQSNLGGGEDDAKVNSSSHSGSTLNLLDSYINAKVFGNYKVRAGQFKVPSGRENLTNSGYLTSVDRSIADLASKMGRDVGVALYGNSGIFSSALAVQTGGGRDIPTRHIPERLGFPQVAVRVGINHGYDGSDMFDLRQVQPESKEGGFAAYLNGVYINDSNVGHSTALKKKAIEKSLILDTTWNPSLSAGDPGYFYQVGADVAFRKPFGSMTFTGIAEGNFARFKNNGSTGGEMELTSGYSQIGLNFSEKVELGLRYAFIAPDVRGTYSTYKVIHETTPSLTYFFGKHLKLVADLPVTYNSPVVHSNNDKAGSYALVNQPDQITTGATSGNTIERLTVVEARLMLQFQF